MKIIDRANYEDYILANGMSADWKKRDFVTEAESEMEWVEW